jgi:hypothetical protein
MNRLYSTSAWVMDGHLTTLIDSDHLGFICQHNEKTQRDPNYYKISREVKMAADNMYLDNLDEFINDENKIVRFHVSLLSYSYMQLYYTHLSTAALSHNIFLNRTLSLCLCIFTFTFASFQWHFADEANLIFYVQTKAITKS